MEAQACSRRLGNCITQSHRRWLGQDWPQISFWFYIPCYPCAWHQGCSLLTETSAFRGTSSANFPQSPLPCTPCPLSLHSQHSKQPQGNHYVTISVPGRKTLNQSSHHLRKCALLEPINYLSLAVQPDFKNGLQSTIIFVVPTTGNWRCPPSRCRPV